MRVSSGAAGGSPGFFGFLGLLDVEVVSAWRAVPEVLEPTTAVARARLAELAGERVDVAA